MKRLLALLMLWALSLTVRGEGKTTRTTQKELHAGYRSIDLTADDTKKGEVRIDRINNGIKDDGETDTNYRRGNASEIVVPPIITHGEPAEAYSLSGKKLPESDSNEVALPSRCVISLR